MVTREEIEERRVRVAEAASRVLVRDGLTALSVRNVAAEAGLAPSSLRYAVPTQADLREGAIDLVYARLQERIDAVDDTDEALWASTILQELLPLDEQRRIEMKVGLALGTAAMTDEELMPVWQRVHDRVREVCVRAMSALLGEAASEVEVDRVHGLIDGLALHIVRQPERYDSQRAVAALDAYLQTLKNQ